MEQSMDPPVRKPRWLEILAIIAALCGAFIAVFGAAGVYTSQVTTFNPPMWPLPGLILTYWALLGIAVLVTSILFMRVTANKLLYASWAINGAFIPLILLGALSIGLAVFLSFVFCFLSTTLSTVSRKGKLLISLVYFVLGVILSAGILLATLAVFNPQVFTGINQ